MSWLMLPEINPSVLKNSFPSTCKILTYSVSPLEHSVAVSISKASPGDTVGYTSLVNKKSDNLQCFTTL